MITQNQILQARCSEFMKGAKGCDSVVAQVQRLDLWHPHSAKGFYTLDLIVTDAQVDQLVELNILDVPQYGRLLLLTVC